MMSKDLELDQKNALNKVSANFVYSHGLEEIYQLKNVDVKTVRVLSEKSREKPKRQKDSFTQLFFPLPSPFKSYVTPLFYEEPIASLKLSMMIEKSLKQKGFKTLYDLVSSYNTGKKEAVLPHQEEVERALDLYLSDLSYPQSFCFDCRGFFSLFKRALLDEELSFLCKTFGLQAIQESSSGREDPFGERAGQLSIGAISEKLKGSMHLRPITKAIDEVFEAFILSWMVARGVVATKKELEERTQRFATDPSSALKLLSLYEGLFLEGKSFFNQNLIAVEENLFAPDRMIENSFKTIKKSALSFFVSKRSKYEFKTLLRLVEEDLGFAYDDFIIGCFLRKSSAFTFQEDEKERLIASCLVKQASHTRQGSFSKGL